MIDTNDRHDLTNVTTTAISNEMWELAQAGATESDRYRVLFAEFHRRLDGPPLANGEVDRVLAEVDAFLNKYGG